GFQVPLATIATAHVMDSPGKMPGVHIVDTANQGYYFFAANVDREQRDRNITAFPQGIERLLAFKPSITRETHPWKDHKTVMHSYTPAAVTGGTVCNPDYDLMHWGPR